MAYSSLWHHYISWYGICNNFFGLWQRFDKIVDPFQILNNAFCFVNITSSSYASWSIAHMRFTSGITLGRDETRWKLSVTAEAYASPACSQLASILTHPATLQIFSLNRCRLVMWSSHCELDLISYQKCKKRRKKPTLLTVSVYPPSPHTVRFSWFFFGVFISDPSPIIALCIKNNGRYDIEAEKREELENKSSHKSDIWPPA